jgi:hypothetical protein
MVVLRGCFAKAGCAADAHWSDGTEKGSWGCRKSQKSQTAWTKCSIAAAFRADCRAPAGFTAALNFMNAGGCVIALQPTGYQAMKTAALAFRNFAAFARLRL